MLDRGSRSSFPLHAWHVSSQDDAVETSDGRDDECSESGSLSGVIRRSVGALSMLSLFLALLIGAPQVSDAAYGPSGAVVTSPPEVSSLTLEDFLNLPEKKQRQFEGGFVSCAQEKGLKKCKPVSLIDGLLSSMGEDELRYLDLYQKLDAMKLDGQNLKDVLMQRSATLKKLAAQPDYVVYGAAFLASTISTIVVHPLDTLKTRLMNKSSSTASIVDLIADVPSLYDGIFANIVKEAPPSALYLGIYETSMIFLSNFDLFADNPLFAYLLSGALGELFGSMVRAPAEAVKTRVQTDKQPISAAIRTALLTSEGRRNTFAAWSSSLMRDVPAGAIQIAIFELAKVFIVQNPNIDFDVNTLLSEAALGALGGGIGAFLTTPSDVVTTRIISGSNDPTLPSSLPMVFKSVLVEDGAAGFFRGSVQRTTYWALAIGIFLSCYCSLRQLALSVPFS